MATVKDVAREAGVSQPTVSRALNGNAWVSDETRERVRQAAARLGYRPNRVARSLVRGRTQTIGVIVPAISNSFTAEIVNGIHWICTKQNHRMLLGYSDYQLHPERDVVNLLLEHRVDGLICVVNTFTAEATEQWLPDALQAGTPCVLIDHRTSVAGVDYVVSDDLAGAVEAVNHLLKLGHRRIGYLCQTTENSAARERHEGYRTALAAAGIEADDALVAADPPKPEGPTGIERLMALEPPPTAVFTLNDFVAANALPVLAERGIRVPHDLAVVGFSDVDLAQYLRLTTVRQPTQEMGLQAARRLFARLEDPKLPGEGFAMPTRLVIRHSCGATLAAEQATGGR